MEQLIDTDDGSFTEPYVPQKFSACRFFGIFLLLVTTTTFATLTRLARKRRKRKLQWKTCKREVSCTSEPTYPLSIEFSKEMVVVKPDTAGGVKIAPSGSETEDGHDVEAPRSAEQAGERSVELSGEGSEGAETLPGYFQQKSAFPTDECDSATLQNLSEGGAPSDECEEAFFGEGHGRRCTCDRSSLYFY